MVQRLFEKNDFVAARPNDVSEQIAREKMVAEDKLKAEGRVVREEDNPGMALQFSHTYRVPPRTQIHRVVE